MWGHPLPVLHFLQVWTLSGARFDRPAKAISLFAFPTIEWGGEGVSHQLHSDGLSTLLSKLLQHNYFKLSWILTISIECFLD